MSSRKLRVYIAGPITKGVLLHNVNQATEAFVTLAKVGFAPLCPHWSVYSKPAIQQISRKECYDCIGPESGCQRCKSKEIVICEATAQGNDQMTHADWLGVDLPWVEVCDAVLRLPGESKGADDETRHANAHGIPVFHSTDELIAWRNRKPLAA